jgi:hypothetical protein
MLSTPPVTTRSSIPAAIRSAPKWVASCPEPQRMSTVIAPVSSASPRPSQAFAGDSRRLLADLVDAARDRVVDARRVDPGPPEQLDEGPSQQLRRVDVAEDALLTVPAPDRGADRLDDVDVFALHAHSLFDR